MGTIADKLEYLNGTKDAIKAAIEGKGVTVPDGTTFRGYASLIASMPSGGTYQEKTATPTGEQFDVLPDAGYDALSKVTIAGDTALKPWNIPEGTAIYGVVGTAKLAVGTDPPADLPVSKDDADAALAENDATADTSAYDLMVLAQDDGNITYCYLAKDTQNSPFTITSYDPITTEFKAKGWRRLSYHTTGEQAGTWTYDDFTDTESGGWNYLKNVRSCTRAKLYYQGVEVWPNMLYKQSLADSSWATISQISKSGNAESYYSIGDEKDIELTTGEILTLRIIGFNHDVLSDGAGYSGITFETKHLMSSELGINSSNTNVGGWKSSAMRARLQPGGSIYNVLPQEVQDVIRPVNKVTSVGNAGSALETTSDYAFLLSEVEIFCSTSRSVAGEGKQYAYYESYATTNASRIKRLANGTGSVKPWWERSPYSGSAYSFCCVYTNGTADYGGASAILGVSFGFCV